MEGYMSFQERHNQHRYNHNRHNKQNRQNQEHQAAPQPEAPISRPVEVSLQSLLETGSHFGTNVSNWNPKMRPYIYGIRNNVYIINLEKTIEFWDAARQFVVETVSKGGDILFVGTKKQIKEILKEEASACGSHFVAERWLGGTLTNLPIIKNSIERLNKLEKFIATHDQAINKKEKLNLTREIDRLTDRLGGLRNMKRPPAAIFLTDPVKDHIAVEEARKMHIPIIALADTDSNPDYFSYPIPANDDGTSATILFIRAMADAVLEGKKELELRMKSEEVSELAEELSTQDSDRVEAEIDTSNPDGSTPQSTVRVDRKRSKPRN